MLAAARDADGCSSGDLPVLSLYQMRSTEMSCDYSIAGTSGVDAVRVKDIRKLFGCHVESFNYLTSTGFTQILECLKPQQIQLDSNTNITLWLEDLKAEAISSKLCDSERNCARTPRGCREGGETYSTPLSVTFCWKVGHSDIQRYIVQLGQCPVMVRSHLCALATLSPEELVVKGEEAHESGGYFIINGIERMIRMIIQQRRHHILALRRRAFMKRSPLFSEFATVMRCVAGDEHSSTVRLHYMRNGSLRVGIQHRRQEFFLPAGIVLRALTGCSDAEIHERVQLELTGSAGANLMFVKERLAILEHECHTFDIYTQGDALSYLGQRFRSLLNATLDESDITVGERLLEDFIFIHLCHHGDKFSLLILMIRKLFSTVTGHSCSDDPDSLVNQEILLPGLLLQTIVREKLRTVYDKVVAQVESIQFDGGEFFHEKLLDFINSSTRDNIGKAIEYFLATGNLVSPTGLGLSQASGFTIVAEKLNYFRYISHFRSVHRGAYFMELRTTTVRKLLPESWGFLCPVHTPDGSPCGLLNHLAELCEVVIPDVDVNAHIKCVQQISSILDRALVSSERTTGQDVLPVLVEGAFFGYISASNSTRIVEVLRCEKRNGHNSMRTTEVCYIPSGSQHGLFPGLYIFYGPSRLMRPVQHMKSLKQELIGTLEQSFLSICPHGSSASKGFTHAECCVTSALSCIASLTPWSDFNQSPRNMYQCQMAKQTMGIPAHSICYRSDTKLYRLHTPQRPLAVTCTYDKYSFDDYALGTNAVVAVLSYTGYDMEDAMIVNKGSIDRGFAHATLYKTVIEAVSKSETIGAKNRKYNTHATLDSIGIAHVGSSVLPGATFMTLGRMDQVTQERQIRMKGSDPAIVDRVVLAQSTRASGNSDKRVAITLRHNRNPVIGDKFSSRHGQKGVLSFLWPEEDMPFSDKTGLRPDIIINPHAFPSRMTIGMLVESVAAKAGAISGIFADATPFQQSTSKTLPSQEFRAMLRKHGYSYCGGENLINSYTGESFDVDIFIGLVYYQRLRHMVSELIFFG